MTLRELEARLREAGIAEPRTEARLLFSHLGGFSPASLLGSNPSLSDEILAEPLGRRLSREPLAYILGEVAFCHETYRVTPDCLIPRADTECLVEAAMELLPPSAHFADFCTGSGCVAISTLAARTDTHAHAYDISEGAITLAKENARRNGVADRLTFERRDLLAQAPEGTFDAILSNPPYIPASVIPTLSPEVLSEPGLALDGGEDGMDFYRRFLSLGPACLKERGFFLFEIGYDQGDAIKELATSFGYKCSLRQDLGGNVRVAYIYK